MKKIIYGKKPAIFLDRDGVLIKEKSYICDVQQVEVFNYTKDCITKIKEKGYYTIVITNQSGIARGLFTETMLNKINHLIMEKTGVDKVYYCPHYTGGTVTQYAIPCKCRKPNIGMIDQACKEFSIDMEHSFMIGDRASDIEAGTNANIRTVLLESGYGSKKLEKNVIPDYILRDLRDVIKIL